MMASVTLDKLTPPKDISVDDRKIIFEVFRRKLAAHRNASERYAREECRLSAEADPVLAEKRASQFIDEVGKWVNALSENVWVACDEPGSSTCPVVDELTDTSTRDLGQLPPNDSLRKIVNTVLFLHITSTKQYSARTRTFFSDVADGVFPDEDVIAETLKNPKAALSQASESAEAARSQHASANKMMRRIGIGASAVAGGVLIGVTGGLAAPLVGAGVTTVLAWLGAGGTAAGLLASGLAGSSAVCTALFGAYGARSSARMAGNHLRDVADFAILPVASDTNPGQETKSSLSENTRETLAVRICVSGWLSDQSDVTAPWTIFDDNMDTFALQWEVAALEKLSSALTDLIKSHAMKYVKGEIIRRTVLASLMASLSPIAWLKLGQLVDNPWSNARALAIKTGILLASLLKSRAFGTRPVTLTGYSLGALVILSALNELSRSSPHETAHLVQDAFLLGTPAPAGDLLMWTRVRRVVAGRLVNAYVSAEEDYVLAILARLSLSSLTSTAVGEGWGVAGLQPVLVAGVENVRVDGVQGHVQWRGMVGRGLATCGASGLSIAAVENQEREVGQRIAMELDRDGKEGDVDEEKRLMEEEEKEMNHDA